VIGGKSMYVLRWNGNGGYISKKGLGSSRPYTLDIKEAKTWTTLPRVERYLSSKCKEWAKGCTIIPKEEATE